MTVVAERPTNGRVWKEKTSSTSGSGSSDSRRDHRLLSVSMAVLAVLLLCAGWLVGSYFDDQSISEAVSADLFHVAPDPWSAYIFFLLFPVAVVSMFFAMIAFSRSSKRNRIVCVGIAGLMAGVLTLGVWLVISNGKIMSLFEGNVTGLATEWVSEVAEEKLGEPVSDITWVNQNLGHFKVDGVEYSFALSEKSDSNFYLSKFIRMEETSYDAPK